MLEHCSPLDALLRSPSAATIVGRDFEVLPLTERGFILIQGDASDARVQAPFVKHVGRVLPEPRTSQFGEDYALHWMAPREWLLELPMARTAALQALLATELAPLGALATDLSDGYAELELKGARAAEVLMTGCSLDLNPEVFKAGRTARTALADVPVVLYATRSPAIRCLVERPFAEHVWNWLVQSTARW